MSAWNPRANEIFLAALEIEDAVARHEHLDASCAGDADLRRQVDALLAADQEASGFLEQPPGGPVLTDIRATSPQPPMPPPAEFLLRNRR